MTRTEFVQALSQRANISEYDAKKAVASFLGAIIHILTNGDGVNLTGFGVLEPSEKRTKARGVEKIVRFRTSKVFKKRLKSN